MDEYFRLSPLDYILAALTKLVFYPPVWIDIWCNNKFSWIFSEDRIGFVKDKVGMLSISMQL